MMHGWGFGGGRNYARRFEEQYHCYSVAYADKPHLEVSENALIMNGQVGIDSSENIKALNSANSISGRGIRLTCKWARCSTRSLLLPLDYGLRTHDS
jgi:hypothetical protein